ncbi:hypothetical protein CBR_g55477 [Chara braunii]|uniref:Uncharacterized protein n=1 Tax=Chara braunii TaxID=69332 RepID=A0A388K869_CHABU|nr:hypothetical protein CBR_g55477 [Chara braunii]|eukprot:GBG66133.1 hypothetical protein CBR_g55477 [Chara braunii]
MVHYRRVETPWSYTSLLNEGLCDDDGNAAVDLSFQLSSSSGAAATHTRIINPHPSVDCADNTHGGVCGPRDGGLPQSLREGGGNRNESTLTVGGGVGARERPEWMWFSPASRSGSGAPGRQRPEDLREEGADEHRDGRQLWAECKQALYQRGTETITRGVQRLHVDEGDEAAIEEAEGCDDVDGDNDCNSDDLPDIRPLGRKATNGGATARKGPATKSAGAGGDTMALEGGGEAANEEQGSTKDSTFSAGSGGGYGKRKNMRQQIFEAVAEVMDKHCALMANTMDSASKRQRSMMLRQCEILESEVEVQRKHYAAADEANRMMVHLLLVWDFFNVVVDHRCGSCRSPSRRGSFSPQILLAADPYRPFGGPASLSREDLLLAVEQCPQGSSPSRVRVDVELVRSHKRPLTEAGSMSAQSGVRGKKRENIPADTQGRERGRRHVPKAKRLRSEEASASLPLQRGRSWAATNEEEDDDVFTTKEEAAEDNVPAPRGSSLQRSSDQSGARRLLTPPPEAQQVRAHNTPKAKEVVVDVGGKDDEPLESRKQRNVIQGATATAVRIHATNEERPPQGGLPSTPFQPRPQNTAAEEGSMERGGGEGAQQKALVASGGAIAGAAAGSSGNVAAAARAREEVPVVEREVTHGNNKGEREDEDPLLSRVRRGGMARDLAERARLWVDDKAFWTTGVGRRLYNIVPKTREYFVAIANGLQTPAVPRSVVMSKSSTTLTRIADPAQLQQAIARAMATENIALHVLHGWVFKSGNRPQGFNVAFQYALESVATDTARDRPEDDNMAAHQEATVICIAHAFRAAVQMGGIVDGGFISHDRLSRSADCFRLLLAACMWLMRMAGDNPRSHYEAFYFAKLVVKPTLVVSMHHAFDHRRSVIRATNAVTERLGKANATFGDYPKYIADWASCGIVFGHDATITGPKDAKRRDWLGSGPLEDDDDDDGKEDA